MLHSKTPDRGKSLYSLEKKQNNLKLGSVIHFDLSTIRKKKKITINVKKQENTVSISSPTDDPVIGIVDKTIKDHTHTQAYTHIKEFKGKDPYILGEKWKL